VPFKTGDLKIKLHRPLEDTIKTCTLKHKVDEWYAVFACELPDPKPIEPKFAIGIDVGVESFLATLDGEFGANPRWLKSSQAKLRRLQRSLACKKKGGQNRGKTCILVAQHHRTIKRQRLDLHHQIARDLVDRYDVIAVEDLT
jgi:putative transposase